MSSSADVSVTWRQALAWRAERHLLDPVGSASVVDVVRRLGAVLAMDAGLAELSVGTRRTGARSGDLAAALDAGEVVKAFAFRGAVHYLAPDEAGTYLALRAAGRQWELTSWVEHYRLSAQDWPRFRAAVREALDDGPLTITELGETVSRRSEYAHLRPVFDDGAGTLVKPLCWQGDVSIARARGGRLTVQRMDANPRWTGLPDLDDAGPRAVTAYLGSYGPATFDHVEYWLGQGLSAGRGRLRAWFAGLEDTLVPVEVEGTTAYVVADDVDALVAAEPSDAVRFLPGHDQWVIGPGTKDQHVTPAAHRGLITRKRNPVVVGGVVRGTWVRRGDEVVVTWLGDGPPPETALATETARLGHFVDRDLTWTPAS